MYGDISRPFDSRQNITRVIFNQGKPVFEADLNEALNAAHESLRLLVDLVAEKPNASRIGKWKPILSGVNVDLWSHGLSVGDRVQLSFYSADIPSAVYRVTNISGETFQISPSTTVLSSKFGDVLVTPIADPFRRGLVLGKDALDKLIITNGVIFGGGILAKKQGLEYATPVSSNLMPNGYLVQFDTNATAVTPTDGAYVVTVAMQERPLLLSELGASKSFTRNTRSAEFRQRELQVILEKDPVAPLNAEDMRNQIEGRNSYMEPPDLEIVPLPKRLQGLVFRLEVHSLKSTKCKLKLGIDNAYRCIPAKGPLNNLVIEKEFLKDISTDLQPAYVEVERKGDLRWAGCVPNDFGKISTDWKSIDSSDLTQFLDKRDLSLSPPPALQFQDQLRLWQDVFEITSLSPSSTHTSNTSVVFDQSSLGKIEFTLKSDNSARWLRQGDYWLISYDPSSNSWSSIGYRKSVHFAPVGTVTYLNGALKTFVKFPRFVYKSEVEEKSRDPFNSRLVSALSIDPQEKQIVRPQLLHGVSCGQIISRCDYPPIQRWLSSMTLDELAKLSFEQLRYRILEDCRIKSSQIPIVESKVKAIIAERDQLLQQCESVLA